MPVRHTWEPKKRMFRNENIDILAKDHCYEITKFPAYLPDEIVMQRLRSITDPNVILYIAMMKGVTPIVTIGDHKSFVASLKQPKTTKHLPKFHSPSYSNIKLEEKHLRDRRGFE